MSDEDRSPEQTDDGSFTYGINKRGDVVIDGTVVEKNPHGVGPESAFGTVARPDDEVAQLRAERDRLAAKFEDVEPIAAIIDKPIFREIVNEYVQRGELEPPRAPAPAVEDVVGYRQRLADAESAAILHQMREYAETLPEFQAAEINNNHRVFNKIFDRFKAAGAGSVPVPRQYAPPPDRGYRSPQELRAAIERKRVNPGFVEPPGPASVYEEADDGRRAAERNYAAAKARVARAYSSGGGPVDREAADVELVRAFYDRGGKSRRRSGGDLEGY